MGKEVEKSNTVKLFQDPKHPYTRSLLNSIPQLGKKTGELATIKGMVPSPFNLPPGCVFHPRCDDFMPGKCDKIEPQYALIEEGHAARCLLYEPCWPDTSEAQTLKNQSAVATA